MELRLITRRSRAGLVLHFAALLLLPLLAACATAPAAIEAPPKPDLRTIIDRLVTAPPFDRSLWGIRIEEEDGTILYDRNSQILFQPASNRKLFSAALAAECLGLTSRLGTDFYLDGQDVIIRGGGDPSFGAARHESPGFRPFVKALRHRGITSVQDVIVDVSAFDRTTIPGSWKMGNLVSTYAAPVDAVAFQENAIGSFAVADPAIFAGLRLRDALRFAGIAVKGEVRVNTAARTWGEHLARVESPTVYQLLYTVLKNSHNLYAEMLLKAAGGGTYSGAFEREKAMARQVAAIDPRAFRFVDGSGLSPDDLVAPSAIIQLLRWMNAPSRRGVWWEVLAQPGGEGTLRNRLASLSQRVRGKTGTIAGVNALSGMILMSDGRYRYFAILVNHHTADSATPVIDRIVQEVAR
ncbi:MAG TPA: D-alanyl-D-alanine carboxypeptidase [Thermoanaerobaculia bacterium]|nr:D-alanyl-D-alanine carboxypeptidase [Thermoanaerobaculia bacterium]